MDEGQESLKWEYSRKSSFFLAREEISEHPKKNRVFGRKHW